MIPETQIEHVLEGQILHVYLTLKTADGTANAADFDVYGGATDNRSKHACTVTTTGEPGQFLVAIPGLTIERSFSYHYQICARRRSDGTEWVCLHGKINLTPRVANQDYTKLFPRRIEAESTLAANSLAVTMTDLGGPRGERGYSAYEIAVEQGFEGTAAEWLEHMRQQTATLAVQQVTPLMERAETAADKSERKAAAAKTEQETAAAHAAAAKESEVAAAGHKTAAANEVSKAAAEVMRAAAQVDNAKVERLTAAQHMRDAEKAAQAALANQQGAEKAAQDAAQAQAGATQAKTAADAAKTEAQTAAGNAKASATAAAASQTAAEKAKLDAQAAQTKAEQEASKAEQNAALLGDAALKGADNTFTGLNTFAGEVAGVLPWDFFAYSWCKTKEELWAACPDIEQRSVFCADLSSMNIDDMWLRIFPDNILKLNLYYSGELLGNYCLTNKAPDIAIFAPNATKCGKMMAGGWMRGERLVVYAPKCNFHYRFCAATYMKSVTYITKMTQVTHDTLGNGWTYTEEYIAPFNVVKSVDIPQFTKLKNVPYGFHHATYINMNAAKLNKASVMAILNDLKPYDATTMTTVPELSIGIDPALDGDEEINAALLNAQEAVENGGKGWNVAVAGFTVTAGGGATMALRRPIYAMRRADAEGAYIDADGTRWRVRYGNTVLENWAANEELGYTEFPTIEAALEEWGLTEYVPEVPEETLTNE